MMDLVLLTLIPICIALFWSHVVAFFNFIRLRRAFMKLPGYGYFYSMLLLVDLARMSLTERLSWVVDRDAEQKDGFYKCFILNLPVVRVRKPEHLEAVLPATIHLKKCWFYDLLAYWLGQGLLCSSGEKWFADRRLLTPAFHFNILEQFAGVMNEKTQILLRRLEQETKENPGKAIEIFHISTMYTLDIICETAMGLNINAQESNDCEYVQNLHKFSRLLYDRYLLPWSDLNFIYNRTNSGKEFNKTIESMHKFTTDVIRARKLSREQKRKTDTENVNNNIAGIRTRKAFLDLLLDTNEKSDKPMTDQELREQVDTFMFTGHDTTAAALSWALFCLGTELEIQEKVHEELDEVFGDSDAIATAKQLSELKCLDRVIKEALRLYPSAPEICRHLQTDIEIAGYMIPKGVTLLLSPYLTHRDPVHWPEPEKFDPDRFLPDNMKDRHPYAYIPFSAGPRNCIGQKFAQMEEKIALTAVLRKYRVKSVENRKQIRLYAGLILRPENGIYIHLIPKNQTALKSA